MSDQIVSLGIPIFIWKLLVPIIISIIIRAEEGV